MTRTDAALPLLALLAACAVDDVPRAPRPAAVVPGTWFPTSDAIVEITGEDFHVGATQRADGGGSTVDASYRAWLGPAELLEVTWIDERTLRARVPAGLAVGWHDLLVQGPFGTGVLGRAYLVEAGAIAEDPFQDGSAFAFVAAYRGKVVLGPNRTGTGLVRMEPDGTAPESLDLAISRDSNSSGAQSSNSAYGLPLPGTYPSIGFTGCTTNSAVNGCGPDNEDGRGFMTSVAFAGDEWLVLGGARSGGDLDYVYMSRSATGPLEFSYVDLSLALGGNTRGFSAVAAAGGRLYLGFPDNGGSRPYGLALLSAPAPPGLDAALGTHVIDLNLDDVYGAIYNTFASVSMVDTIAELDGRLYFFNDSGCVAATSLAPATKTDFTSCSPAEGLAYAFADAVAPIKQYDLEPRDRAWPAAVAWKGRLFAVRNTYTGPQLWRCDPSAGTDPTGCDRADWTLVAADASTGYRTRFGKPGATAAALLLATSTHLWVGLDDPEGGVHLFRTSADEPALSSDFVGQGGCVAGTAGCQGFGGDGFGAPANLTRIFDAKAIEWSGGTDLILAVGNGTSPAKIVRVAP